MDNKEKVTLQDLENELIKYLYDKVNKNKVLTGDDIEIIKTLWH